LPKKGQSTDSPGKVAFPAKVVANKSAFSLEVLT